MSPTPTPAIDLRSDTVTRPDDEMRRAMASAVVGDDVFEEDPTVLELQEEAAAAVGQEAALFVASGTMGNQIALHLHGGPGREVICEAGCHLVHYELGAMAALSGLLPKTVAAPRGLLEAEAVERAIAPDVSYRARTGLIAVENSHNMAGGTVYPPQRLDELVAVARRHDLPIHLDGARIFNAATALGVPAERLGAPFDSVMFCLSKGLGAPVGSLLCGSAALIREARRVRKMFGGGMRQVGVLAAAGLVALRKGPARLAEDHANARRLAEGLAELPGLAIDPATVETNIVIVEVMGEAARAHEAGPAAWLLARLGEAGVLTVPAAWDRLRLVTHRDVSRFEVDEALRRMAAVLQAS